MVEIVYVDEDTWNIYNNSKILNNISIGNKEKFFVALALGFKFGQRSPLEKKHNIFRVSYLTEEDRSLLYALAIKDSGDLQELDEEIIINIAEEYANTGIKLLENLESNCSYDEHYKKFSKLLIDHFNSLNEEEE